MTETKVYIGYLYGKGLFHTYDLEIDYGISIFLDRNLGDLIKHAVRTSKDTHIKLVPTICRWKSFIHE